MKQRWVIRYFDNDIIINYRIELYFKNEFAGMECGFR